MQASLGNFLYASVYASHLGASQGVDRITIAEENAQKKP